MDGYIKKSEAVDVIVKYPYNISGKTATAIKMIEDLPSADVVPKSEVEELVQDGTRLVQENETLKDNNEHLAVMLQEARIELEAMRGAANSLKMHYEKAEAEIERLQAEKDALIKNYAECMKDYASEIFAEIEFDIRQLDFDREETRAIAIEGIIAKAKKKYTEKDQL